MRAALLKKQKSPLDIEEVPMPVYGEKELLIKVHACGLCRTDLHIIDADLPAIKLPLILGHEIVGTVVDKGKNVSRFKKGDRVGIPWLGQSCCVCEFCKRGEENLCDKAEFTGYHRNGGFAEYTTCFADYAIPLSLDFSDEMAAPFLCAGMIGYRSYRIANAEKRLGMYGFGAAAHLLIQLAVQEGKEVYAFTREDDYKAQEEARKMGAVWAGSSLQLPPKLLDAAILFAAKGDLVPFSLKALKKGGRCVCGGIHMTDIPSFPYKDLWGEKSIRSVANLTREDAHLYFEALRKTPVKPEVKVYSLEQINRAVEDMRTGTLQGIAVIRLLE